MALFILNLVALKLYGGDHSYNSIRQQNSKASATIIWSSLSLFWNEHGEVNHTAMYAELPDIMIENENSSSGQLRRPVSDLHFFFVRA